MFSEYSANATPHLEAGYAHSTFSIYFNYITQRHDPFLTVFSQNPKVLQDEGADTTWPIPKISSTPLPLELYRPIIENIADIATLLALCLTSSVFRFEAQRVLYDSVASLSMISLLAFLRTMIKVDRLALLVHKYHLPCLYNDRVCSPPNLLLNDALKAMINLRELSVISPIKNFHSAEASSLFIFSGCKFQLEALYLVQYVEGGAFFSFLSTQKKLRKLAAYLDNQGQPPPPTVCPKLITLQGNGATMETLLPNRQIATVIWDPDCYDSRRSMLHLSEPLRCLKALSFEGCYLRPSLRAIVDHLQGLEFLELVALHVSFLQHIKQHDITFLAISADPHVAGRRD
jgi:hypothetical protein